jgi:16S rRNA A1518/A1519 N6-dimethyltransferase RsmA/KsgA/DIM1 with predicted DNA glycosylase/AP lyase activity
MFSQLPHEYIEYLISDASLTEDCTIADIGSGTGILTRQLLERGFTVNGVERNDDMSYTNLFGESVIVFLVLYKKLSL